MMTEQKRFEKIELAYRELLDKYIEAGEEHLISKVKYSFFKPFARFINAFARPSLKSKWLIKAGLEKQKECLPQTQLEKFLNGNVFEIADLPGLKLKYNLINRKVFDQHDMVAFKVEDLGRLSFLAKGRSGDETICFDELTFL